MKTTRAARKTEAGVETKKASDQHRVSHLHRTLVIGDIHHRIDIVDNILKRFAGKYEKVVLLGDYFDCFGDSPRLTQSTVQWLAESIRFPNRIHLLGNHDLSYFLVSVRPATT